MKLALAALRKSPSRNHPDSLDHGLYAVIDLSTGGTTHPEGVCSPYALTLDDVTAELNRLID